MPDRRKIDKGALDEVRHLVEVAGNCLRDENSANMALWRLVDAAMLLVRSGVVEDPATAIGATAEHPTGRGGYIGIVQR